MAIQCLYEACPYCSDGKVYNSHQERMVDCTRCNAKGWFIINHICACGKPCTHLEGAGKEENDKYLYCGDKNCLAVLKADRREEQWEAAHPGQFYGGNYGSNYFGQGTSSVRHWHTRDDDELEAEMTSGYVWPGYGSRLDA